MVDVEVLLAVKDGMGDVVPEIAVKPIAVLLVPDQLNEVPDPAFGEEAVSIIGFMDVPGHSVMSEMTMATGFGLTVIV